MSRFLEVYAADEPAELVFEGFIVTDTIDKIIKKVLEYLDKAIDMIEKFVSKLIYYFKKLFYTNFKNGIGDFTIGKLYYNYSNDKIGFVEDFSCIRDAILKIIELAMAPSCEVSDFQWILTSVDAQCHNHAYGDPYSKLSVPGTSPDFLVKLCESIELAFRKWTDDLYAQIQLAKKKYDTNTHDKWTNVIFSKHINQLVNYIKLTHKHALADLQNINGAVVKAERQFKSTGTNLDPTKYYYTKDGVFYMNGSEYICLKWSNN